MLADVSDKGIASGQRVNQVSVVLRWWKRSHQVNVDMIETSDGHFEVTEWSLKSRGDVPWRFDKQCKLLPRHLELFQSLVHLHEIRQSKSVEVFKTKLNTSHFKEYYEKKGVCI